ncbi:hypothetical protein NEOC65_002348 [Neochlamydia sp. AcF65]|nr:hypothetical protein [Neochlamydia sp. AcF65]
MSGRALWFSFQLNRVARELFEMAVLFQKVGIFNILF